MILSLYLGLVGVALVMIVIGLTRPSESAQALVGFFFLFLLSFVVLNGNLEYKVGSNSTIDYSYTAGNLTQQTELQRDHYSQFNDTLSHRYGVYLAIAAAVGFAGVLFSVGRTYWRKE